MDTVQLKFETMRQLWQFRETQQLRNFEIQSATITLYCQLSAAAIKVAVEQFGARQQEKIQSNTINL